MQITFDLNPVDIQNEEIVKLVQSRKIDELKSLFVQFLSARQKEMTPKQPKPRWAEFGEKMIGRITEETADEMRAGSREFREGFDFRDLNRTK